MSYNIVETLRKDVRLTEGLNACMNCGICTSVCPAAEYFDYDPRSIAITVQSGNEQQIRELLESDTIWYCGQCMSCKTRCPRDNCPGLIINALRRISQETGAFVKSHYGRQQYLIMQTTGQNILKLGYCVHPTTVMPSTHPEQGPVWRWVHQHMEAIYEATGGHLFREGEGAMRQIAEEDLDELHRIFDVSGGTRFHDRIRQFSTQKAIEMGFTDGEGHADMDSYLEFIFQNEGIQ